MKKIEPLKIVKAFFNWVFGRGNDISSERMKICNKCELIDKSGKKCVISGTQPCCGVCGCSLTLLTRSFDSECPHPKGNKWKTYVKV